MLAFFLLQHGKVTSDGMEYLMLNLVGAVMILVSLLFSFNLASFVIEICWIVISIYGIIKYYAKKRE